MSSSPRVGVACPNSGERAALADWLRDAAIEPVFLVDACLVSSEVAGLGLAAVVADAALLSKDYVAGLRRIDTRLPILAVGDAGDPAEPGLVKRGIPFHARPMDRGGFLLAISLVLAEGRPARRSFRRLVPRLPSKINGAEAFLLDVSTEGLRLEVSRDAGARLGPHFKVQVPMFNVGVTVQRVWVKSDADADPPRVQCGASLIQPDERVLNAWRRMVEHAPQAMPVPPRQRPAPARVPAGRMFGRVAQLVADAPIVGALAHLPWRGKS